jgi:protoheme ferro-lyase
MDFIEMLKEIKPTLEAYSIESLHSKYTYYRYLNSDVAIVHLMRDIIEEKTLNLYKDIM